MENCVLGRFFPNIMNDLRKLSSSPYQWCFYKIRYIGNWLNKSRKSFRKLGLVHKYTKRKFKCGWTGHGSLTRRLVRLNDQVSLASGRVRLQLAQANSVQKQHFSLLRASLAARSSELCLEAPGHARLRFAQSSLERTLNNSEKKLRISKPFSPNTPILILPYSKFVPNEVYRSCM